MQSQEEWSTLHKVRKGHIRQKMLRIRILAPPLEGMRVIRGLRDKEELVARLNIGSVGYYAEE